MPRCTRFASSVETCLLLLSALLMLGCVSVGTKQARPRPFAATESFERAGPENGRVYVLEAGREGAPWILLVHGLGEHATLDYEPILPALAQHYHVLAVALPGFGRSPAPAVAYSPEDYVRVLHDVLRRRTQGAVAVVGHSMAGALALLFASTHPESVGQLALLDVAGILHFREYARSVVGQKLADRGDWLDPFRRFAHALFRVSTKFSVGTELNDLPIRATPATKFLSYDFGHALHDVRAPVWIGWGKHDRTAPLRTMEALSFSLHPVGTAIYEKSGHVPMRSEPWKVAQDLLAFFSRSAPAPSGMDVVAGPRPKPLPTYVCREERDHTIEGEYDRIELDGCKNIKLRNVRARSLHIAHSTAELWSVELIDGDVGLSLVRSRLTWTGGRIRSKVCVATAGSHLDLMGVHCDYQTHGIVVRGRSHLVASVSGLSLHGHRESLHGGYTLERDLRSGPVQRRLSSQLGGIRRNEPCAYSVDHSPPMPTLTASRATPSSRPQAWRAPPPTESGCSPRGET